MHFEQYRPVELPHGAQSRFQAVEDSRARLGIGTAAQAEQESLTVAAKLRNKFMRTPMRGGQNERPVRGNKAGQTGNKH